MPLLVCQLPKVCMWLVQLHAPMHLHESMHMHTLMYLHASMHLHAFMHLHASMHLHAGLRLPAPKCILWQRHSAITSASTYHALIPKACTHQGGRPLAFLQTTQQGWWRTVLLLTSGHFLPNAVLCKSGAAGNSFAQSNRENLSLADMPECAVYCSVQILMMHIRVDAYPRVLILYAGPTSAAVGLRNSGHGNKRGARGK